MFRWLCLIVGAATVGVAGVLVVSWIMPHSADCCEGHSAGTLAPSRAAGGGDDASQQGDSTTDHAAHAAASRGESPESLTRLSKADRLLAEKQGVCPVSGNTLGSMGEPHPATVKGQTVFLCCPSCEESIRQDPDKYLAKLAPKTT